MIVDALIFIAQLIASMLYAPAYFLISVGKIILLVFKPLWFVFFYIYGLVVNLFSQNITTTAIWTPDTNALAFFNNLPFLTTITSTLMIGLMIITTINAFKHDKK